MTDTKASLGKWGKDRLDVGKLRSVNEGGEFYFSPLFSRTDRLTEPPTVPEWPVLPV